MGTLLAVVLAIVLSVYSQALSNLVVAPWIVLLSGPLFLVIALFSTSMMWRPLQRTQEKIIASTMRLFFRDAWISYSLTLLFAFCLFSFALILFGLSWPLLALWVIAFGISFDILRFLLRHMTKYTAPVYLLEKVAKELKKCLREKRENEALELIFEVMDSASQAIEKCQISRATHAFNAIEKLTELYIKELARVELLLSPGAVDNEALSFLDKVNFLSLLVCERFLWLFERALSQSVQPAAEELLVQLGKLSIFLSHHNERPALLPLTFLAKAAKVAHAQNKPDLVTKAALTLSETTKAFLRLSLEKRSSCKELIFACLRSMEQVVKMIFQQNREINPALLMQPFAEVGQLLGMPAMGNVQDREEILRELRRILTQFQSLEMVLPNVGDLTAQDTSSSFQQDTSFLTGQ